jgi:predicted butyrate kinase (DUF1464 family)
VRENYTTEELILFFLPEKDLHTTVPKFRKMALIAMRRLRAADKLCAEALVAARNHYVGCALDKAIAGYEEAK